jgi:hypothetical protein
MQEGLPVGVHITPGATRGGKPGVWLLTGTSVALTPDQARAVADRLTRIADRLQADVLHDPEPLPKRRDPRTRRMVEVYE